MLFSNAILLIILNEEENTNQLLENFIASKPFIYIKNKLKESTEQSHHENVSLR